MSSSSTLPATATNDDDEESETIPTTAIRSSSSSNANDKENNIVRMGGYQEHEEGKHDADASTTNNDIIMNYPIHVQQSQPQRREDDRGEEEYERAVRRALTENEYVKQINSQLVAKLNIITTENEASKGSIHKLTNVCQSMKELIIELANAKDTSDNKLRELEKVASVSSSRRTSSSSRKDGNDGKTQAKVVTLAKLEALEIGQRSMDEMISALRESLDVACRERDEANEKVAELTTSLVAATTSESSSAATSSAKEHATTQTSGGGALHDEEELWKGKLALVTNEKESWVQKYNDSSTKLAELTMERDALQVKYDEMQEGINTKGGGVETIFISKMIMEGEGEEDDWKTKYGELTEQLKQLTSERNALSEALDSKCKEDWETKYGELTEQLKHITSERNVLSEALDTKCKEDGVLTEQLKQVASERDSLRVEINTKCGDWETKYGELDEQLKQVISERTTLREEIESKCEDWETKYGELDKQLKQVTSERDSIREALDSNYKDWETKYGELDKQLTQVTTERNVLSEALDNKCKADWETKYGELNERLKQVTSERDSVTEALDNKMQAFSAEKKELEETIDLLARDSDDWQDKYNKSGNELVKITAACDGLQIVLREAQESMKDSKSICDELAAEKATLEREIVALTKKVEDQSSANSSLQLELDTLQSTIEEINNAKNVEVERLRKELESASASLIGASREFDTMTAENGSLRQDIALLEKERDDWQSKYNGTANNLAEITSSRDGLESELQSVRSTMNDSKRMCEDLTAEKAVLEKKLGDLMNKVNELSGVNSSVRQVAESLNVTVDEITAAKELEVGNLRQELEIANASLIEAFAARDILSTEIGTLRHELAIFSKDSVHWHEKYVKCATDLVNLTSKCDGLEAELRETAIGSNRTLEDLSIEKASMQEEILDLTKKIDEHSATNSSLQQEIDYLQYKLEAIKLAKEREVENLKQELESASSSLVGASSERENMAAENCSLRQRICTLEADITLSSQVTRRLECADAKNDTLTTEVDYLKSENGTLQHQIQNLQCYVSEITACHNNSIEVISPTHLQQAEKEYLSKEMEDLTAKNEALQQKNNSLQDTLSEVTAASESASDAFQLTIDGLRVQLVEREDMGKILAQQLKDSENEAHREQEQLKSTISSLEEEFNQSKLEEDKLRIAMESLERSHAESVTRTEHDKADYEEQIKSLCQTLNSVTEKIALLEADLLQSKQEEEKVRDAMALMERGHAEALSQMEDEKAVIQDQVKSMSLAIDTDKETTAWEQEQARLKISSLEATLVSFEEKIALLEADLLQSKKEEEKVRDAMALMERSHAEALSQMEDEKAVIQDQVKSMSLEIDTDKETAGREQEHARLKISSLEATLVSFEEKIALLEADLLQSKEEEEKVRDAMILTERSHAEALARMEDDKAAIQREMMSMNLAHGTERETAGREHEHVRSKITSIEAELLRAKREVDELQKDKASLESKHADSLAQSEHEQSQLKSKLETIEVELIRSRESEERLRDAMKMLENSHVENLARLKDETAGFQNNIKSLNLTLDAKKEEMERLKSQIHSLEDDLLRSKEEENSVRIAMESMESSHAANVTNLLSRLEELKDRETAQGQETHRRIEELTADVESASKRLVDANTEFENQRAYLMKSLDEKTQMVNSLEGAKQEMAVAANVKVCCLQSELDEAKSEACRDRDHLYSRIAELEADLLQSTQAEDSIRSAMKSLEMRNADTQARFEDEINQLEARFVALAETSSVEKKQLEDKVKSLETETHALCEERTVKHEEMNKLVQKSNDTQQLFDASAAENAALTEKCNVLENEVQIHLDQIEKLTSSINDTQMSLDNSKQENKCLGNELSEAKRERELAMTKVEELSDELKLTAKSLSEVQEFISRDRIQATETQQQLRSLEAEKKQLEESILSIRSDRENINHQLEFSREEAEDFRRKWESSESVVESLTNQCEVIESEFKASKQVVLDLNIKLESSESLVKALEDQCDQLRSMTAELTTKSDEADALVKVLQLENHRNIARCKQQEERSNSEIACLENIIKSLKTEYEAFKVEAKAASAAQLRSCEAKLEALCANGSSSPRSQDQTFDDMVTMLRRDRFLLIEKTRSTAKQLEAAQKDISVLERAISSLRKEYETFRVETEAAAAAQIRLFEAKLVPLCSFREGNVTKAHNNTLDEMLNMIQNELSSTAKELEVAQDEKLVLDEQVCILSTEVSKFKLQNKGLLKALDDITKNM